MESFPLLELPKELIYLVMSKIKEREDFINMKKTCKFLYYNKNVQIHITTHVFFQVLFVST